MGRRAIRLQMDVTKLDQIQDAFARMAEPKRLVLLPYAGLDLRFDPGWTAAMAAAVHWFDAQLTSPD